LHFATRNNELFSENTCHFVSRYMQMRYVCDVMSEHKFTTFHLAPLRGQTIVFFSALKNCNGAIVFNNLFFFFLRLIR